MGSYRTVMDTFKEMMQRVTAFTDEIAPDPFDDHYREQTTDDEFIDKDFNRPFALATQGEYGAVRTTEGQGDIALGDNAIILELQMNHQDGQTHQQSLQRFTAWMGDIIDELMLPVTNQGNYIEFEDHRLQKPPTRTPHDRRKSQDDFWCTQIQLRIRTQ